MPFRLALRRREGKLAGVHTDLANLKTNLDSLKQLVELAREDVELKRHDVDRKTTLLANRAGSQADIDNTLDAW